MRAPVLGLFLLGCGAATPAPEHPVEPAGPPLSLDVESLAAPIVELRAPTSDAIVLRGALVKSDAPPTDAWDPAAPIFARAFCIGETCFSLRDHGRRSVSGRVTAVGPEGGCAADLVGARELRAHLDADAESGRAAVEQGFVVLEVGPCEERPNAAIEAIFGAPSVEVIGLRGASWQPAGEELTAVLDAYEERTRALYAGAARVPIFAAQLPACGITLARGLAVYWVRDGTVNQPFDAARFVRAGEVLYAFSAIEGLDPLLERLDRVTCTVP